MPSPDLCFVYGTLRRGCGNHHVMQRAGGEFVGQAVLLDRYPLVVDGLPYLLPIKGKGHHVIGELYRIPKDGWEVLDRLEGHPRFYRRRVESFLLNGELVEAWAYFLARVDARLRRLPPVREFGKRTRVTA